MTTEAIGLKGKPTTIILLYSYSVKLTPSDLSMHSYIRVPKPSSENILLAINAVTIETHDFCYMLRD